jgi:catechol 2,3-dioxygenase-like lactoylglutathione lyase family enzyme
MEGGMTTTEQQHDTPMNAPAGPPTLKHFAHLSLPCRDLEEAKRFYVQVMGAKVMAEVPHYVAVELAGVRIGLGTVGCSFIKPACEYPHMAFYLTADEIVHMRRWLAACKIPVTPLWTRTGVEGLCFLRDPSANLIELFCKSGLPGADKFPRGHANSGAATDIESLYYDTWSVPPA